MNSYNYEQITEYIQLDFEEYQEEGLSVVQCVSKIIEEDQRAFSEADWIKYAYLVRLGIESQQRQQLADFLYDILLEVQTTILTLKGKDAESIKQDFQSWLNETNELTREQLIELPFSTRLSARYYLKLPI